MIKNCQKSYFSIRDSEFLHDKAEILENEDRDEVSKDRVYKQGLKIDQKVSSYILREGVVSLELLKDYKNDYKVQRTN